MLHGGWCQQLGLVLGSVAAIVPGCTCCSTSSATVLKLPWKGVYSANTVVPCATKAYISGIVKASCAVLGTFWWAVQIARRVEDWANVRGMRFEANASQR
jgi:hypothetical protein